MVTLMQINIVEQLPGYIAWKDNNLRYLGCNDRFASLLRLSNSMKIIGLSDNDLIVNSEESLIFYKKSDELALCGNVVKIIHQIGTPDTRKSFYLEKKPLL